MNYQDIKEQFVQDVDSYGKPKKLMSKIKNIFEYFEKTCIDCKYFQLLDMDGLPDERFGFPYCEQKIRDCNKTFRCNKFQSK